MKEARPPSLGMRVEQGLAARLALLCQTPQAGGLRADLAAQVGGAALSEQDLGSITSAWALLPLLLRVLVDLGYLDPEDHPLLRRDAVGAGLFDEQAAQEPGQDQRLREVLERVAALPAAAPVFGAENPLWRLALSADGAGQLLSFYAARGLDDKLLYRFSAGPEIEQVLADLYQSLDGPPLGAQVVEGLARARGLDAQKTDKLVLVATPLPVARFLVEQVLAPLQPQRETLRFLDPACGAGSLLTQALEQLVGAAPVGAQRVGEVLARIGGLDLSPLAVLLARFRLLLAALRLAGVKKLREAPAWPLRVALADALSPWGAQPRLAFWMGAPIAAEILAERPEAIACEPPFVPVKDAAERERHRGLYRSARGQYSLVAPFVERCFQLTAPGGSVGMLVANRFMKREYGKALVEEVLAREDLTLLVDAEGAFLPGHGTPMLLLFGRRRPPEALVVPVVSFLALSSMRAARQQQQRWETLGQDAARIGFADEFITVDAVPRSALARHPWSLGTALPVLRLLEAQPDTLASVCTGGAGAVTGADDLYRFPEALARRQGLAPLRRCISGDALRDLAVQNDEVCLYPYDEHGQILPLAALPRARLLLESLRPLLASRRFLGTELPCWYGYLRPSHLLTEDTIVYPQITHYASFVPAPEGALAVSSAQALRFAPAVPRERRQALLGLLNSSYACTYLRQRALFKADPQGTERYALSPTLVLSLPLPALTKDNAARWQALAAAASHLLCSAAERVTCQPADVLRTPYETGRALKRALSQAQDREQELLHEMVYAQEEVDWLVYQLLGLYQEEPAFQPRRVRPNLRPFAWVSEAPPALLPADLRERWGARRRALRAAKPSDPLAIFEEPTNKRAFTPHAPSRLDEEEVEQDGDEAELLRDAKAERAATNSLAQRPDSVRDYQQRLRAACDAWLLDRLVTTLKERGGRAASLAPVARRLEAEPAVQAVLSAYPGFAGGNLLSKLRELALADAVPALSAQRFSTAGMEKRQRLDAGEPLEEMFVSRDYLRPQYWRLRGRLDIPRGALLCFPESGAQEVPLVVADLDPAQEIASIQALYQELLAGGQVEAVRLQPLLQAIDERQRRTATAPTGQIR